MKRRLPFDLALATCLVSFFALSASAQPAYEVWVLGSGHPTAVNVHGTTIGWESSSGIKAWVATADGDRQQLPLPPGATAGRPFDINDHGVIVGLVASGSSGLAEIGDAVVWTPNDAGGYDVEVLEPLTGYPYAAVSAINSQGDILGYSQFAGTVSGPATWFTAPGGPMNLVPLGFAVVPADINEERQVVGNQVRMDLDTFVVEDLGIPPSPPNYWWTRAGHINEAGQVAGTAHLATSGNDPLQVARFTDGVGWEVLSPAGALNTAFGIDQHGSVLMQIGIGAALEFAVYENGEGLRLIDDLLPPNWSTVSNLSAAMNEVGQLVVEGGNSVTQEGGVLLLTPATGEANWASYGAGTAGTLGVPSLTPNADPVLGTTILLNASNSSGAPALAGLFLGLEPAATPLLAGTLLVDLQVQVYFTMPAAGSSIALPLPDEAALVGQRVHFQVIQTDTGVSQGAAFSRGLLLILGT